MKGEPAAVTANARTPGGRVVGAWDALRTVLDPELCLDIVSLGLVYRVAEEHDRLVVEMTLTTPGCPASESLPLMAEQALTLALGSGAAEVHLVWEPPWDPRMIGEAAAVASPQLRRR